MLGKQVIQVNCIQYNTVTFHFRQVGPYAYTRIYTRSKTEKNYLKSLKKNSRHTFIEYAEMPTKDQELILCTKAFHTDSLSDVVEQCETSMLYL